MRKFGAQQIDCWDAARSWLIACWYIAARSLRGTKIHVFSGLMPDAGCKIPAGLTPPAYWQGSRYIIEWWLPSIVQRYALPNFPTVRFAMVTVLHYLFECVV